MWARMAGYDWLSAGMGSCLCAGYFVWRGDDAGASLVIAATATIAAVVFEEVMRDGGWCEDPSNARTRTRTIEWVLLLRGRARRRRKSSEKLLYCCLLFCCLCISCTRAR